MPVCVHGVPAGMPGYQFIGHGLIALITVAHLTGRTEQAPLL